MSELDEKSLIQLRCCWNIPPQATRCLAEPDCFPICLAVGSSPQCQVSHSAPEGISFEHHARPFPRGRRCYLAPIGALHHSQRAATARSERKGRATPRAGGSALCWMAAADEDG